MNEYDKLRRIDIGNGYIKEVLNTVLEFLINTYEAALKDETLSQQGTDIIKGYLIDVKAMSYFVNEMDNQYLYLVPPLAKLLHSGTVDTYEALHSKLSKEDKVVLLSIMASANYVLDNN